MPPVRTDQAADQALIERTRRGERSAYAELWRRHSASARTVARSYSSLDPDDLVAESFTKIYDAILAGGGPRGAFRPYLFTTIRNTAAGWGRARHETNLETLESFEDPSSSESATLDALDRSTTAQAFRSLPTRWQEVLWYSEVENMTPQQIAPIVGMSANSTAALAYRAREGLRQAWIQAHLRNAAAEPECQWSIDRLGGYTRGRLRARETARLEAHLDDCARCTIVAAEAREVGSRLALVLLPLAAGIGGATAYSAWLSQGAPVVNVALGGAGMPAVITGAGGASGSGSGAAGAGSGAGASATGATVAGAAGGSGLAIGVGAGALALAAVAVAAVIVVPAISAANQTTPPAVVAQVESESSNIADAPDAAAPVLPEPQPPLEPLPTPAPVTDPEPVAPDPGPGTVVPAPVPAPSPAPGPAPGPAPSTAPSPSPSPAPEPDTEPVPDPTPDPTPDPEPVPDPTPDPAPDPEPDPEPVDTEALPPAILNVDTAGGLVFPIITGTAESGARVLIESADSDRLVTADATSGDWLVTADATSGDWRIEITGLRAGATTLLVTQTDLAGNRSESTQVPVSLASPSMAVRSSSILFSRADFEGVPSTGIEVLIDGRPWFTRTLDRRGDARVWIVPALDRSRPVEVRYSVGTRVGPTAAAIFPGTDDDILGGLPGAIPNGLDAVSVPPVVDAD
ncbi:sigma-70 family RNA polymerase sigma factor [Agromyces sp. ISL-38]|uniref:sigma-70 family RNA polymerase sigma factor n=1 Tax=Agromyces sp. ISL-38 TaxID=2819107 RepID=UPI001BE61989|nr:sigma-70 family RNA polymerase sigma factor [Agromyces sp. ISL-38]MBT2498217.1 sigma-70 family RNA polymerase sigma factor [Agromyces sp. ISL-38]